MTDRLVTAAAKKFARHCKRFGARVTFTREVPDTANFDAATGAMPVTEEARETWGIYHETRKRPQPGAAGGPDDSAYEKRLLLPTGYEPRRGDKLTVGTLAFTVEGWRAHQAGGLAVGYEVILGNA